MEVYPLRRCSRCGVEKPVDQFAKDRSRPHGREYRCRKCKHDMRGIQSDYHPEFDVRTRFAMKTKQVAGCLIWTGYRDRNGYGKISVGGKLVSAPRLALEWKLGRPLGEGMLACHTCDNPPCVLQDHLFEGTKGDNARDAMSKGRMGGFMRNRRIISEDDIAVMRALADAGMSQHQISAVIGISQPTISVRLRS